MTQAAEDNWAKVGDALIVADALADEIFKASRVEDYERVAPVDPATITRCAHPFRGVQGANGYWDFDVPMLPADHVTDDAGTGFVHTAPGHGADDYITYLKHKAKFAACGTDEVPHTVAPDFELLPARALLRGPAHL